MASGSATCFTNGKQTGRCGDPVDCGSSVATCSSDTFAGDSSMGTSVMITAISVIEKYIEDVKTERVYNEIVTRAINESYSEIQTFKQDREEDPNTPPPLPYVLSCKLGDTSQVNESGGLGPYMISSGVGDKGGVSYGSHQLKSEGGFDSPAGIFVRNSPWSSEFSGLLPGSTAFSSKWTEVVTRDEEAFKDEEYRYYKGEYYDRAIAKLGLDESVICFGVKELIWSTAIQMGAGGCAKVFRRCGVTSSTPNLEIIDKVYKEKSKVHIYYKSSPKYWNGILKRYTVERLQNIDACNGEECDEVPQGIENATTEDLGEIKADNTDLSTIGKEDWENFDNN